MSKNTIKTYDVIIKIIITAFIFTGCSKDDDSEEPVSSITDKTWTLKYIQNVHSHFLSYYPDIPEKITIEFADNKQLLIQGICNEGTGNFAVENDKLTITSLVKTDVLCNHISWEDITTNSLSNASHFEITGTDLIIYSESDFNLIFE